MALGGETLGGGEEESAGGVLPFRATRTGANRIAEPAGALGLASGISLSRHHLNRSGSRPRCFANVASFRPLCFHAASTDAACSELHRCYFAEAAKMSAPGMSRSRASKCHLRASRCRTRRDFSRCGPPDAYTAPARPVIFRAGPPVPASPPHGARASRVPLAPFLEFPRFQRTRSGALFSRCVCAAG